MEVTNSPGCAKSDNKQNITSIFGIFDDFHMYWHCICYRQYLLINRGGVGNVSSADFTFSESLVTRRHASAAVFSPQGENYRKQHDIPN